MSIKPKPVKFLLRMEQETYEGLNKLADKYNVSLNSEINTLLICCLKKWNVKTIKVRDIPQHIQDIQDQELTPEELKEYDELLKSFPQ